jgi:hypothetical protein
MRILPAIDLLGGNAVRLHQGRYEEATVYDDDPPAVARRFRAHVDAMHVVDLEGAKAGAPVQRDGVRAIVEAFAGGAVQVGGGVRSRAALEAYLALGARRVVLGTAAVKDPELVRELARAYPGVVVLAVDAKGGFVATDGWTEVSQIAAVDLVRALADRRRPLHGRRPRRHWRGTERGGHGRARRGVTVSDHRLGGCWNARAPHGARGDRERRERCGGSSSLRRIVDARGGDRGGTLSGAHDARFATPAYTRPFR